MGGRPWTDGEISIVRESFGSQPTRFIAERLNRSYYAVFNRAKKLGLVKPEMKVGAEGWRKYRHIMNARTLEVHRRSWKSLTQTELDRLHFLRTQPTAVAYWAGLFDGEGSVVLRLAVNNIHLSLCNTNKAVIDWLCNNFNGTMRQEHRAIKNPKHHDAYIWVVSRSAWSIALLELALPYLIIKKNKAIEAIDLFETKFGTNRRFN